MRSSFSYFFVCLFSFLRSFMSFIRIVFPSFLASSLSFSFVYCLCWIRVFFSFILGNSLVFLVGLWIISCSSSSFPLLFDSLFGEISSLVSSLMFRFFPFNWWMSYLLSLYYSPVSFILLFHSSTSLFHLFSSLLEGVSISFLSPNLSCVWVVFS